MLIVNFKRALQNTNLEDKGRMKTKWFDYIFDYHLLDYVLGKLLLF